MTKLVHLFHKNTVNNPLQHNLKLKIARICRPASNHFNNFNAQSVNGKIKLKVCTVYCCEVSNCIQQYFSFVTEKDKESLK